MSGEISIRYDQRQVSVVGRQVELTATEYELLRVLTLNAGRVVAHDTLFGQAWSRSTARWQPDAAANRSTAPGLGRL